jgi:hypothetical protein
MSYDRVQELEQALNSHDVDATIAALRRIAVFNEEVDIIIESKNSSQFVQTPRIIIKKKLIE